MLRSIGERLRRGAASFRQGRFFRLAALCL